MMAKMSQTTFPIDKQPISSMPPNREFQDINPLQNWQEYLNKMTLGDIEEVDHLEFSPSPGDTYVLCLYLTHVHDEVFEFSIQKPVQLANTEDVHLEEDDEGNFNYPETIDGQDVKGSLGDFWVGFDTLPYPDETNLIRFNNLSDPKINKWLEANGWQSLDRIDPGWNLS
jgi:hypothetical protein